MNDLYDFLFKYLEKEEIQIDKAEFSFQAQSHPEYPSLLSISDTLIFFNINNIAAKIDFNKINRLPDRFVTTLYKENGQKNFNLVERDGVNFFLISDKKSEIISKEELEKRWTGIVMLVEKPENGLIVEKKYNRWLGFLQYLFLAVFLLFLVESSNPLAGKFFVAFPIAGILFSIAALKDLFGTKNKLLNNFCNITAATSCSSVINSGKWRIFEIINFSDLSIIFFSSQLATLFVSLFKGNIDEYFTIQIILVLTGVPFLGLSLYYQKFVEKKWCPICLAIISIVLAELSYLVLIHGVNFVFSISSLLYFVLLYGLVLLSWVSIKDLFTQRKELKEFKLKGLRFMHNYEVFKKTLISSEKTNFYPLSSGNLLTGNKIARLRLTIIFNIYCGHCVECHQLIIEILKKFHESICVDFRFNFNSSNSTDEAQSIHRKLIQTYYEQGEQAFLKNLTIWFETKDEKQLLSFENLLFFNEKADQILQNQFSMNLENDIQFTPTILINNLQYPRMYDRKELIYFIRDLLEDEDFQ